MHNAVDVGREQIMLSQRAISPFLKWAGGKRWATNILLELAPKDFTTYREPFLGGGSLFFALRPKSAVLSDLNRDLINAYRFVRDDSARIDRWLNRLQAVHSKDVYYKMRERMPLSDLGSAIRFIYLNRTCWNGLYRVNRQGKFNVPIGSKSAVSYNYGLTHHAGALSGTELIAEDFEIAINRASVGDFLYVDPPYTVRHNTNGFLKYNEHIFSWEDQERLKNSLDRAIKRGAKVLISNAAHASIRDLYAGLGEIFEIERSSILAADPKFRRKEGEVIVKCF